MSNHIPNLQLVHNIPNSFKKIRRESSLIQAKNMKGKKCKSEVNSIPVLVQQRAPGDQKRERADSLSLKQIFLSTPQISGNFFRFILYNFFIITKKSEFRSHFLKSAFHISFCGFLSVDTDEYLLIIIIIIFIVIMVVSQLIP